MGDGRVGTEFCYVHNAHSRIRKPERVNIITSKRVGCSCRPGHRHGEELPASYLGGWDYSLTGRALCASLDILGTQILTLCPAFVIR